MNIIAIDTANDVLSIALSKNGIVVGEHLTNIKKDHSSRLMPALVDMMEKVNMKVEEVNGIVVGQGPGSYTGTRIGVTTAKTLAWSLDIPIYPISSLEILAYNGVMSNRYLCPFFDARRETVFTALYQGDGRQIKLVKKETNIPMQIWLKELQSLKEEIIFMSPHMDVFQEMIIAENNPSFLIANDSLHLPRPANMIHLQKEHEAMLAHAVTPNYLRITEAEAKWLANQKGE